MLNNQKFKVLICFLLVFSFLLPYSQITSQYLGAPTAEAAENDEKEKTIVQRIADFFGGAVNVIGWIGTNVVLAISLVIGTIIGTLAGAALRLFSIFINHGLEMSDAIITLPVVTIGWGLVRDLVNLFFVLIIIIISLATILRIEQYGIKKLLANLIIAALLINFSLLFASVFIDFANILSDFFLKGMPGAGSIKESVALGTTLATAFQPQRLFDIKNLEEQEAFLEEAARDIGTMLQILTSLAFVVAFSLLIVFCFALLAIMFYVRVVALAFLLVLSPAVILCAILPDLQALWKKWWEEFIRWCFFAPISLFFIYLAVQTMKQIKTFNVEAINPDDPAFIQEEAIGIINNLANTSVAIIILFGFIIGGIMVANSLSIGAGKGSFAIGGKVSGWLQGVGKQKIIAPTAGRLFEGMQKAGAGRGWLGRAITLPIRRAGGFAVDKGLGYKANFAAQVDEMAKKIKGKPIDGSSYVRYDKPGRLAYLQEAIKQEKLDKLPNLAREEAEELYRRAGKSPKELYTVMPTWKPGIYQAIEKEDFQNASQLLSQQLSSMKNWEKIDFKPLFNGDPSVRPKNISKEKWDEEFLPWLGEAIRGDSKAGSKIGKAFSNLNSAGISELARTIKQKGTVVLSPEQLKKENASLYHYLTSAPARKAQIDIQKTEDIQKT